jgi:hypothetical protein
MQGRWASDQIFGGGLVLPEGISYWPIMGMGDLDYGRQSLCFAASDKLRTYEYRYNATTYQFIGYQGRPEFDGYQAVIKGQELGPDGKVYLSHSNQWQSAQYQCDSAVKVFG